MSGLPSQEKDKAKTKAPKPKKPSKQRRKLAAALAKLELPTQASEDLAFLYRKTTVAQALAEALEEFGETQELPEHVVAETMEAFDKAILQATEEARNVACRVKGRAELEAYNNIDERWRFCLKDGASLTIERNMSMNQDERGVAGPLEAPCSVLAVDVTRAVKGGGAKQRTLR